MPADFGYINARIRGLRSKLLRPEFFTDALNTSDFSAFVASLSQTSYMREVEEAQSRYEGVKIVDDAAARNFYTTTRSILNFSDGEPSELIALLLLRYDLNNLKAIARAKHAGRSADEISSSLLPAGELKPAVLEIIAAAADMAAVAQAVAISATPLRSAFVRAATQYSSDNDLYALELSLDRAYYRFMADSAKTANAPKKFKRYLIREIDATNLLTALSLRGSGEPSADVFVPGGLEITRSIFEAILSDESSGSLQVLSTTSFAALADASTMSEVEAALRGIMDASVKSLTTDPMNIGLAASYLRMKEAETAKLRLLARGKYYGVPSETLAKELGNA